jgi:formamidopyrimidine-DNA glycosylase
MPELPDINAYLSALETRIVGRTLERVRLSSPFVLRTAVPPIDDVQGYVVRELRRIGKRVAIGLNNDLWLVIHLMISGRLQWRTAGAKLSGRNNLAALRAMDPGGIEVFAVTLDEFRAALTAENRTLKRALTDPRIVSGIGNAYSEEILHAAELSPVTLTRKLNPEEWERLYLATLRTLERWTQRLSKEAEFGFPEKVTAFRPDMAVHGRFGQPCPRCGETVQRIRYADSETNYCARCQTGGAVHLVATLQQQPGTSSRTIPYLLYMLSALAYCRGDPQTGHTRFTNLS